MRNTARQTRENRTITVDVQGVVRSDRVARWDVNLLRSISRSV
jgi:hypothetical protein